MKEYKYLTGNVELCERVNNDEDFQTVMNEISAKWTPGNEHLWDDYNIESLITPNKKNIFVNHLLYARIKKYRLTEQVSSQ